MAFNVFLAFGKFEAFNFKMFKTLTYYVKTISGRCYFKVLKQNPGLGTPFISVHFNLHFL